MFRHNNPAMSRVNEFGPAETWAGGIAPEAASNAGADHARAAKDAIPSRNAMTIQGTINKTALLLFLTVATAIVGWEMAIPESMQSISALPSIGVWPTFLIGALGGLVMVLITFWKPKAAPITGPLYALLEGLFIGGVSALYAVWMSERGDEGGFTTDSGLIMNAVLATFATTAAMLGAYATRLIRVTNKLRGVIVGATIGAMLMMVASWIFRIFGVDLGLFPGSVEDISWLTIGISVLLIVIAAFNLLLDFDFIENGAKNGAPKLYEWLGAVGLLVTLVWLYVEFLRLLWMLKAMTDE